MSWSRQLLGRGGAALARSIASSVASQPATSAIRAAARTASGCSSLMMASGGSPALSSVAQHNSFALRSLPALSTFASSALARQGPKQVGTIACVRAVGASAESMHASHLTPRASFHYCCRCQPESATLTLPCPTHAQAPAPEPVGNPMASCCSSSGTQVQASAGQISLDAAGEGDEDEVGGIAVGALLPMLLDETRRLCVGS